MAEIDAKVGGFGLVPEGLEGAIVSSHYFLFKLDETMINRRFLDAFIRTNNFRSQVQAQGSTNYAAIRPNHVLEYKISLPPLDEQRKIVRKIEELATKIEQAKSIRIKSKTEIDSLSTSLTNKLILTNLLDYEQISLGEIASIKSGVTLGRRSLRGPTVSLPYLRVANVQDGFLNLNEVKKIEILESEIKKWLLEAGDILLTEGGDWDKLGRGTVWNNEIQPCIHQNHIFRVRLKTDNYFPEYIAAYIGSPIGKLYFQNASKQTTNLASINQQQLKAFQIPMVPKEEQKKFLNEMNMVKSKIQLINKKHMKLIKEIEALIPSILNKAFNREL